jgi:hypothetical protein
MARAVPGGNKVYAGLCQRARTVPILLLAAATTRRLETSGWIRKDSRVHVRERKASPGTHWLRRVRFQRGKQVRAGGANADRRARTVPILTRCCRPKAVVPTIHEVHKRETAVPPFFFSGCRGGREGGERSQ